MRLASSDRLSAYAKRYIVAFVDKYRVATRRKGIDYDLEANLLIDLAKKLAHGNRKTILSVRTAGASERVGAQESIADFTR